MDPLQHLSDPGAWFAAAVLLGFFVLMWRFRPKPGSAALDWDFNYEYVAEPMDTGNTELKDRFEDMLPADTAGVHLIRFAVMNRGKYRIQAADHLRPVTVAFPKEAALIAVRYDGCHGTEPERPPAVEIYERGFEIPPFDLPTGTAYVFNVVVRDADAPSVVDGGIEGQPAITKLR